MSVNKEYRNKDGLTEKEFLERYIPGDYDRPSVTVDMLIFTIDNNDLKLLLIKRKDHPFINQWAIPGGFVNIDESTIDAAKRELKEETNLENVYMEQLYTWSEPNRDPRMRVISTSYIALVNKDNLNVIAGDDALDASWFTVSKNIINKTESTIDYSLSLKNKDIEIIYNVKSVAEYNGVIKNYINSIKSISENKVAFDHIDIINMAIDRLRNKIEYTPIAFNLVNEKFTLPELQKIYEVILNKKLYKANFRKKILPLVKECNEEMKTNRRPAKLYTYRG